MSRSIALVGCGAIGQSFYLDALSKRRRDFERIWFVDPSDHALAAAASRLEAAKVHSLAEIGEEVHYVIIAAPNSQHFSLAQEALSRGAHVLIEKPFVIWPEEGRELVALAAASNRIIAINQTRRLFPNTRELQARIAAGEFGQLKSIVHNEGGTLDWPLWSGAGFAQEARRTGVIMDIGVHVLDFYQILFQPEWTFVSAVHDGFQGPEGLAEINLTANGVPVSLRLSRYQKQRNVACLSFERTDILVGVFDWNTFTTRNGSGAARRITARPTIKAFAAFAEELLANFLAAAQGWGHLICEPASSLPVIETLDEIYRLAVRYPGELGSV